MEIFVSTFQVALGGVLAVLMGVVAFALWFVPWCYGMYRLAEMMTSKWILGRQRARLGDEIARLRADATKKEEND